MHTRPTLPLAREQGLVLEELGDELLVYDLDIKHAHCLTPLAANVWRACDGKKRLDKIAAELDLEIDDVNLAIDELDRCDLLATPRLRTGGLSRRDFGVRVTKVAAGAMAVPVVLSIAAPAVAASLSKELFCVALTPRDPDTHEWGTNNCNI